MRECYTNPDLKNIIPEQLQTVYVPNGSDPAQCDHHDLRDFTSGGNFEDIEAYAEASALKLP